MTLAPPFFMRYSNIFNNTEARRWVESDKNRMTQNDTQEM